MENVDYASRELTNQDQTISQLHSENKQLKLTNQSLTKDLDLATKLAELRKTPLPDNSPNLIYLKPLVFLAVATIILYFLMKNN